MTNLQTKKKKDVESADRSTTIRINESTRQSLASVATGQESFNDTIARLVSIYQNLNADNSSKILKKGNIRGTEYKRIRQTYEHFLPEGEFSVICAFNDLKVFSNLRYKYLHNVFSYDELSHSEWEVDLQILHIKKKEFGKIPHSYTSESLSQGISRYNLFEDINQRGTALIYFLTLKKILEETFFITLHQFVVESDYFSWDNWRKAYTTNKLSEESFEKDVEKKLRDIDFHG